MSAYSAEKKSGSEPAAGGHADEASRSGTLVKEDEMGHDNNDDDRSEEQVDEQEAVENGPPRDEDDGGLLPPPTVDTMLGFEGSIEGL